VLRMARPVQLFQLMELRSAGRLTSPPAGDDLLTLLRNDHRSILLWLAALADADEDEAQRASLLEDVHLAMLAHGRAEEAVVRRALERDPALCVAARLDHESHVRIELVLGELIAARPAGDAWMTRARYLLELVRQHVIEEEASLFTMLRSAIRADGLRAMGGQFMTARLVELGNIDGQRAGD